LPGWALGGPASLLTAFFACSRAPSFFSAVGGGRWAKPDSRPSTVAGGHLEQLEAGDVVARIEDAHVHPLEIAPKTVHLVERLSRFTRRQRIQNQANDHQETDRDPERDGRDPIALDRLGSSTSGARIEREIDLGVLGRPREQALPCRGAPREGSCRKPQEYVPPPTGVLACGRSAPHAQIGAKYQNHQHHRRPPDLGPAPALPRERFAPRLPSPVG
jgi:hypothetical protein